MRIILFILSVFLVAFQQPKKKTIDRVYFNHDSIEILETNPIDKKTKSADVLKHFVDLSKTTKGTILLRGCSNFDETNGSELTDKRLEHTKAKLLEYGALKENIIIEYFNKKLDLTAKPKKVIDTVSVESKKEFLKAHNRFVEIKFLKRS